MSIKLEDIRFSTGWSLNEVEEQIAVRHQLMEHMIGRLYPQVLASEIEQLEAKRRVLERRQPRLL